MPIYDYHCNKCGKDFDAFRKMSESDWDTDEPCPECGKCGGIEKLVSNMAIVYDMKSPLTRAGWGWNDVLKKINKANGGKTAIRTR